MSSSPVLCTPATLPHEGHVVGSEVAYDLLQDHTETLLYLLDGTMSRAELLKRVGSPQTLDRLVAHGLVRVDGDSYSAVAAAYHQTRQEGMMTFLQRYILPALSASLEPGTDHAQLTSYPLNLTQEAMRGLRGGAIRDFFTRLTTVSEQPPTGPLARLTLLVVGTSDVIRDPTLPREEAALRHLKNVIRQRTIPEERELAVLSQIDFLADVGRHAAALAELQRFAESLGPQAAPLEDATYHLTIATHWRAAQSANRSCSRLS